LFARRRLVAENIGTVNHVVPRWRVATPLTPMAVRQQLLAAPSWLDTDKAAAWLDERRTELPRLLTPLDRLLDDRQAMALENYVMNEEALCGSVHGAVWQGTRVDTSRTAPAGPLHSGLMVGLGHHAARKKRLCELTRNVLAIFLKQQTGRDGVLSAAQAALMLDLPGRQKSTAWWLAVRDAASELARLGW
jgi:hypothetical protein